MRLVRLALENFRQHRKTEMTFLEGLTGLLGPNGVGKTTVVEAIAFSLYGSKALRGKIDDVKRRGASRQELPRVCLVFEHDGQSFRVEREGSEAAIFQGGDDRAIAQGAREVTGFIQSLLGMTYEEFFATYYTEQKGLEFLSGQKGAAERERFILRMVGLDRVERVQERLRGERRDKKNSVVGWESGLGERGEHEARLKAEEAEVVMLREKHVIAEQDLKSAQQAADKSRESFVRAEQQREQQQKASLAYRELESRLEERTRMLGERSEALRVSKVDIGQRIAAFGLRDWNEVQEALRECEKQECGILEAITVLRAEVEAHTRGWREKLAEDQAAYHQLEQQRQELSRKAALSNTLGAGEACPTCGQELGQNFEKVQGDLEKRISVVEREFFAARDSLEKAREAPMLLREAQERLKCQEGLPREVQQRRQALREVELLREGLAQRESEVMELARTVAELVAARDQHHTQVKELAFVEDLYRRERAAAESSAGLLTVARMQRLRVEGELEKREALVERTRQALVEYDARTTALAGAKDELLVLEETDAMLTEFRKFVSASIRPRLAEIASEFIAELTDGRYTAVEVADDFSPTVLEDGSPKPVVSGGEEDILNLCMRLALSQMIAERAGQSFSLLILDEVFGSLDEQRRMNVLTLLEKLGTRFEQIFIISHLDDVKEGVRHVRYIDYDEGRSEVIVTEGWQGGQVETEL